jgi:hypothetical protein
VPVEALRAFSFGSRDASEVELELEIAIVSRSEARCEAVMPVRTTLDIDDDILQAVKELAEQERSTAGRVISKLARKALAPEQRGDVRNGVPLLPPRTGEDVVTADEVQRLRDDQPSPGDD